MVPVSVGQGFPCSPNNGEVFLVHHWCVLIAAHHTDTNWRFVEDNLDEILVVLDAFLKRKDPVSLSVQRNQRKQKAQKTQQGGCQERIDETV